ncbi:MAG TPA: alpha/beta fold hydrolase [Rhizomicrobium sp.]|nr:alpha/beta fold hydrolase [Rhizomicrobium sp.]
MHKAYIFAAIATCLALAFAAPNAIAAPVPCTSATAACMEWITLGNTRAMVYRTYPLDVPNSGVRRALIMVHGALRNADHYFRTATGAAFLADALGDTLVIAPAFHSADGDCKDKLEAGEANWPCDGNSWRSGGDAIGSPDVSSFDFVDAILKKLADKRVFPDLAAIVVAGHSAGGQFVARYQMANRVHETLGVPVTYAIANPSSYAWPDASRDLPVDDGAPQNAVLGWKEEAPHTHFSFGALDAAKAPNFDRWPYGLEGRSGHYFVGIADDQLKKQLVSRPATYLLSQVDTLPLGGFDGSPNAMAQGATRRARGEAFVTYVNEKLGGHAQIQIVSECGHNDRCVFTTDTVLPVIFPAVSR